MTSTYIRQLNLVLVCLIFFICCKGKIETTATLAIAKSQKQQKLLLTSTINTKGSIILTRFSPPQGYIRKEIYPKSFASYLRNFPLLESTEKVHLYNGQLKGDQSIHAAILDIDVGNRDLQQCADAIMRLRAEHLFKQKKYNDIAFDFTNGWRFEYSKWRDGNDLVVQGNKTDWKAGARSKENYKEFRNYLDQVFMYAGTLSLSKELKSKNLSEIEIGDVFIKGGSPGHAVLVVDLAENELTGDKAFMLAQSYMPAQQIHVLRNFGDLDASPWYLISKIDETLNTPEWTFDMNALVGF